MKKFYAAILEVELSQIEMMGMKMAIFPYVAQKEKLVVHWYKAK